LKALEESEKKRRKSVVGSSSAGEDLKGKKSLTGRLSVDDEAEKPRSSSFGSGVLPGAQKQTKDMRGKVFYKGYLGKKNEILDGEKKATIRQWQTYWVVLRGYVLLFYKDRKDVGVFFFFFFPRGPLLIPCCCINPLVVRGGKEAHRRNQCSEGCCGEGHSQEERLCLPAQGK